MMVFASELCLHKLKRRHTDSLKYQESLDNGIISAICHGHENLSCHHFLWLQGPGRYIRTFHGDWGLLWADDWYLGPESP